MNRGGGRRAVLPATAADAVASEILLVAEVPSGLAYADLAVPPNLSGDNCGLPLSESSEVCAAIASSCGDGEGRVSDTACPSQLSDLLHELSNLMTSMLLNAQMLEWKLPPYSHLKRPVREVARSAQRGSELMKRLQRRCAPSNQAEPRPGSLDGDERGAELPLPKTEPASAAAAFSRGVLPGQVPDLTAGCDSCTSKAFPKGDDSDGR